MNSIQFTHLKYIIKCFSTFIDLCNFGTFLSPTKHTSNLNPHPFLGSGTSYCWESSVIPLIIFLVILSPSLPIPNFKIRAGRRGLRKRAKVISLSWQGNQNFPVHLALRSFPGYGTFNAKIRKVPNKLCWLATL